MQVGQARILLRVCFRNVLISEWNLHGGIKHLVTHWLHNRL